MTTQVIHSIGATNTPLVMDYTSLAAWAAACPADLVAVDQQWVGQVYNQGELAFSGGVSLTANCSNTQGFILTAAPGASFIDHPTAATNPLRYNPAVGAAISSYAPYGGILNSNGAVYIEVSRLQLRNSGSPAQVLKFNAGGGNLGGHIHEVITSTPSTDANSPAIVLWCHGYAGQIVENCLCINESTGSASINIGVGSPGIVRNCTIVSIGGTRATGIGVSYSDIQASNNAVFGHGSPCCNLGGAGSGSNNATSSAVLGNNVTGLTGVPFTTATFESLSGVLYGPGAGYDFRLTAASTLIDAGSGVSFSASDILGTARPQGAAPDIGAYEVPTPIPSQWPIITWME